MMMQTTSFLKGRTTLFNEDELLLHPKDKGEKDKKYFESISLALDPPLIIGYVGGYSEENKKNAVLYSLIFILGLSITFTLLGAAASAMGQILGFMGRWLYIGLAAIAIIMGLQLSGIISVPLPFQRAKEVKTKRLFGAFLLGLLTGTVSSPCATPVLAVILSYVSTRGDILYGGSLLFVYALGHCALIFIAGLSIGLTQSIICSKGVKKTFLSIRRDSVVRSL